MATLGVLDILVSIKDGDVQGQLSNTEGKVKNWGNKISAWTVAKGQIIGNFATKAIQTVGRIAKDTVRQAFNNFAEYEQLVGGVDTLFKESSKKVQDYAAKAYMTSGVSANKYMETVTSFSASLLQSLGGDTDKAADIADMAMIDMSDNVNKMGSSMESVQNAYRGFAKQNYMMLDNLKLGYGGTKTEMQRLLKDAEALTGKKYDISHLSDVYEAIHAIQEEMGIAGTTQKEAMETVSGSMNAAKAAWQDVLTAIGSGKDIKKTIKNFASTAKTALKNAAPVVRQAVVGLFDAAKELAPELGNIINEVGRGLFGETWDVTINWIQNAWGDVKTAFNNVKDWCGQAYNAVVAWANGDEYVEVHGAFGEAASWIDRVIKVTVGWLQNAWGTVQSAFTEAGNWVGKVFNATVNWVQTAWDDVKNAISQVATGVWNNIVNFTLGLYQGVKSFWESIPKAIEVAVNFVKGNGTVTDSSGNTAYDPETSTESLSEWYLKNHHAKGAWTVPQNDYPALLHRGEMVLNQSQARRYRDGEPGGVGANIPTIIARSVKESMKQVNFLLNGNKVADFTWNRTNRNIGAQNYSKVKAYGG